MADDIIGGDAMEQKMRAAVFQGDGKLEICMVDIPKLRKPDDVLVQVEACSICGTDVHILNVPPRLSCKARDDPGA